jgi:hypothetical protein
MLECNARCHRVKTYEIAPQIPALRWPNENQTKRRNQTRKFLRLTRLQFSVRATTQAVRLRYVERRNTLVEHFYRIAFVQQAFDQNRAVNACHALVSLRYFL